VSITVTAQDDQYPGDRGTKTIWDDYVLVCAGRAQLAHVNVSTAADGTQTHVITVKGVRRTSGDE
jgi:hypothetical protein